MEKCLGEKMNKSGRAFCEKSILWNYNQNYELLKNNRNNTLDEVIKFHQGIEKYYDKTSKKEIVPGVYVKDESERLNTGSFKILGVSYSIYKLFEDKCKQKNFMGLYEYLVKKKMCFVTASDGNFGIALSYFCKILKQKCIVYLPSNTPQYYINRIRKNNAKIFLCKGDYDVCVYNAIIYSRKNNVKLILDTKPFGLTVDDVSANVISGYTTLFLEDMDEYDYMFIPAGVGGLLSAAIQYNSHIGNKRCKVISVEPIVYNCVQQSIHKGKIIKVKGGNTLINGLKCCSPSESAWTYIYKGVYGCLGVDDYECMVAKSELETYGFSTGFTGAMGYCGYKAFVKLEIENLKDKRILIINTERVAI